MSYKQGDALPELVKEPVSRTQLVKYAGASGDYNPIHYDDEAARAGGLEGVIAHGMLSMGFLGQFRRKPPLAQEATKNSKSAFRAW